MAEQENEMGRVYDDFVLKNAGDVEVVRRGFMKPGKLRQVTENFFVDSGADYIYITDDIQQKLQLPEIRSSLVTVADGRKVLVRKMGVVEVGWHDRWASMNPYVLPGLKKPVMGCVPLELLDLMIDPKNEKLVDRDEKDMFFQLLGLPTVA
jgi:clan AA aspartic protease